MAPDRFHGVMLLGNQALITRVLHAGHARVVATMQIDPHIFSVTYVVQQLSKVTLTKC